VTLPHKPLKSSIIEKIIFPIGDLLFKTEVSKQLAIQRSYNHLNAAQLEQLQLDKLKAVLIHATGSCKAYASFKQEGVKDTEEWLKKFPVITKRKLAREVEDYLSVDFDKKKLIVYETSGSSGIRSKVYVDKKEQSVFRAILLNWWEWNGYYLGKPLLQTGISPKRGLLKGIKDFLLSTVYVNAFGIAEEDVVKKLKKIKGKKGAYLFGYASSIYIIAKIAKKYRFNIHFDLAMSQGDKLFDHYSREIESAFQTRVVEDYGCNEGIMIGQKKDLPYFYIYTPSVYLEILDENGNELPDGEMGRVVVTKLDGFAMPLIRYDTGDLAVKLKKENYPDKRDLAFPLLEKVIGRNTDIIKTPDGKSLIVHTFTGIFEFYPEIIQFQVIQNELERISIRYIASPGFSDEILLKIEHDFRQRTKSTMGILWERTDEIPASKSGKPQIIINNLISNTLSNISS